MDFAISANHRGTPHPPKKQKKQTNEKIDNVSNLAREQKKQNKNKTKKTPKNKIQNKTWNMRVTVIPIIVAALGSVS